MPSPEERSRAALGELRVDQRFVARLFLGALSEHEQRQLVARLLRRDAGMRDQLAVILRPFEVFDVDLMERYSQALASGDDAANARRRLLTEAHRRAPDLAEVLGRFTFAAVLELGGVTRWMFTWSMAELLIERGSSGELGLYESRASLYLSLMVIDVVDLLGAAGHSPSFPEVIRDVRRRTAEASERLEQT